MTPRFDSDTAPGVAVDDIRFDGSGRELDERRRLLEVANAEIDKRDRAARQGAEIDSDKAREEMIRRNLQSWKGKK